jgi:hypothetical protein
MELSNLTPFHALAYQGVDLRHNEFDVVVMRVGYKLDPITSIGSTSYRKHHREELSGRELTHQCLPLYGDEASPLVMADRFEGQPNTSCTIEESDLVPFKPKCDVVVRATAYAPNAVPVSFWNVGIRLIDDTEQRKRKDHLKKQDPPPGDIRWLQAKLQGELTKMPPSKVLLDKKLIVCGPREFRRSLFGWSLSEPLHALQTPIRWEEAFGGTTWIESGGIQQINEVCFTNPLGCGWIDESLFKHFKAREALCRVQSRQDLQPSTGLQIIPAPRIEHTGEPIQQLSVSSQPNGLSDPFKMAEMAKGYRYRPAGLGAVGRAWTPRLQKAGTYDQIWLKEHWPYLPRDFNFGYWNCAPEDQQIDWPSPSTLIELFHLAPPAKTRGGWFRFRLPNHRALVLLRLPAGAPVQVPMWIDTLHIDTESMKLQIVWRAIFPLAWGTKQAEAYFDPRRETPATADLDEQSSPHGVSSLGST